MKVLLVNGSPHEHGCTYTALTEVASALNKDGIETDFFWLGNGVVNSCLACRKCKETGRCVFDDAVNRFLDVADEYDGFVFGTAVHYAGVTGLMTAFMDRVFFCSDKLRGKPAAGIVSARRGGTTAALDQLHKYFYIGGMPIATSTYWNMVHGNTPDEVRQDLEGMQVMRTLGRNLAWMIKCFAAGRDSGIEPPALEPSVRTNFIR